jgi:hypothetical protein
MINLTHGWSFKATTVQCKLASSNVHNYYSLRQNIKSVIKHKYKRTIRTSIGIETTHVEPCVLL